VLIPDVKGEAILVIEFQMYADPQIYGRVVCQTQLRTSRFRSFGWRGCDWLIAS